MSEVLPEHVAAAREFFNTPPGRSLLAFLGDIDNSYDPKTHKNLEQTALASAHESGKRDQHKKLLTLIQSDPSVQEQPGYIDTSTD